MYVRRIATTRPGCLNNFCGNRIAAYRVRDDTCSCCSFHVARWHGTPSTCDCCGRAQCGARGQALAGPRTPRVLARGEARRGGQHEGVDTQYEWRAQQKHPSQCTTLQRYICPHQGSTQHRPITAPADGHVAIAASGTASIGLVGPHAAPRVLPSVTLSVRQGQTIARQQVGTRQGT